MLPELGDAVAHENQVLGKTRGLGVLARFFQHELRRVQSGNARSFLQAFRGERSCATTDVENHVAWPKNRRDAVLDLVDSSARHHMYCPVVALRRHLDELHPTVHQHYLPPIVSCSSDTRAVPDGLLHGGLSDGWRPLPGKDA